MNWAQIKEITDWILRAVGLLSVFWFPFRVVRVYREGEQERPQIDLIVKEWDYGPEGVDETIFPYYYPKGPHEANKEEKQFFIRPEKGYVMRNVRIYKHIIWQNEYDESKYEDRMVEKVKSITFDYPLCIICESRDCEPAYFVRWSDSKGGQGHLLCREAYINEEFGGQSAYIKYGFKSLLHRLFF